MNFGKVMYIHGFGTNLKHFFKPKHFTKNNLFPALFRVVPDKNVYTFRWGVELDLGLANLVNIPILYDLYQTEKRLATSTSLLAELNCAIETFKPETIIAHSMGTFLFLNYIQNHGLNSGIKKIVFAQADLNTNYNLPNALMEKLDKKDLQFFNCYCFWDSSLWISTIINKGLKIGNFGVRRANIKNIFFPLGLERGDFHNSVLESKRFSKLLKTQIFTTT